MTDKDWVIEAKVAGVTFEGRQHIVAKVNEGDWLRAIHENDNVHDANAVGLWRVDTHGRALEQVGYVPRDLALLVRRCIADGYEVWGHVAEVTGGYEGGDTLGLRVRLRRRRV